MARPRKIDPDHLIDLAEQIVAGSGAQALSFGALADRAGLAKASVQSVFGTREALIDALLDRWSRQEQARFKQALGQAHGPAAHVRAHIRTTADMPSEESSRIAALLAVLSGSGAQSAATLAWYQARIGDLTAQDDTDRRLRLAVLAAEGAYYLRHLVGVPIPDPLWHEIFADLDQLAAGPSLAGESVKKP